MEAKFGRQGSQELCGPVVSDTKAVGKKSPEWDLNDWKWDGDLFVASQSSSIPLDCRNKQLFPVRPESSRNAGLDNGLSSDLEDVNLKNGKGNRELEKRRRDVGVENGKLCDNEAGSLNLRLGGQDYSAVDEDVKSGKKSRVIGNSSNRAICQVDDCRADLTNAKDYHRRHKVCDIHSKASQALVGNVMQRFCQQCSRFHILQEFDEGKRSCRRRLAGHNRRRRKTNPDTVADGGSVNNSCSGNYLLNSLLRILSSMQASSLDQTRDQDLLSHLLKNLASLSGSVAGRSLPGVLQQSQHSPSDGTLDGTLQRIQNITAKGPELAVPSCSASKVPDLENPLRITGQCTEGASSLFEQKTKSANTVQGGSSQPVPGLQSTKLLSSGDGALGKANESDNRMRKSGLNNLDLNSVYDGSQDNFENLDRPHASVNQTTGTLGCPSLAHQDSQKLTVPQTSRNSESASSQSPSSSSGEAQSRTDRIVFKLFGKDPSDLPLVLRTQILDWLSNSPTDIESYIKPGCIILTIYLRLQKSSLDELCCDLGSIVKRLLHSSNDSFWKTEWVYARVQETVAFIYNGQVVLDAPLPLEKHQTSWILSIKPIAVTASERTQFVVKGFNLRHSTKRLLCALEGDYIVDESSDSLGPSDSSNEDSGSQCLCFDCNIPNISGRGFIEVEDLGLSGSFFPFIVAEQEVCSEICMLEDAIESDETADEINEGTEEIKLKTQALDFIHEMGWLLHRYHVRHRLGDLDPNLGLFSLDRFIWLMEFSLDRDWCAVVNKLLCISFEETIDSGEHSSIEAALLDIGLLHKAVRRNCRPMVELLLRFSPEKISGRKASGQKGQADSHYTTLFRPDIEGPGGLTPLHMAASADGYENILDALTDDPGSVGIQAWRSARDDTGLTPNDYACLRGYYSYIRLVQKKIKKQSESAHVVVDIPTPPIDCSIKQKLSDGHKSARVASFDAEKVDIKTMRQHCKLCECKIVHSSNRTSLVYRPAVLSLVSIAALCVCVALLFKSLPEVQYAFKPFRWDTLKYGVI